MFYTAQITRTNPACFVFLIDQSESMAQPFVGGATKQIKSVALADAINRLLQNLVLRSAKDDGIRDYFHISVIGYGKKVHAGLGGKLPFDALLPISRISEQPLRMETRTKMVPVSGGAPPKRRSSFRSGSMRKRTVGPPCARRWRRRV